jgi:hypothetical protein
MPRKPRDQLFRKTDILRLIEAARSAGLPTTRIRIDVRRDGLSLVVGEPSKDGGQADGDTLAGNLSNEVLTNAADKKRSS